MVGRLFFGEKQKHGMKMICSEHHQSSFLFQGNRYVSRLSGHMIMAWRGVCNNWSPFAKPSPFIQVSASKRKRDKRATRPSTIISSLQNPRSFEKQSPRLTISELLSFTGSSPSLNHVYRNTTGYLNTTPSFEALDRSKKKLPTPSQFY